MDVLGNENVEEIANNFANEQLSSNAPSSCIKEPETSKLGRRVIKPMAKWVSTTKTTRQALKATQGTIKGFDKVQKQHGKHK
jgi:putative component of membrane protein insertase Oxa1/YidC/SpoIIIJ protein YidD